jgi:hypothetical protein
MAANFPKSWLIYKYFAAGAALVLAALAAIGWYVNSRGDAEFRDSPFIQELERAERDKKSDLLKLLFDGTRRTDDAEARVVTRWLQLREQRGDQPYLYLLGLYHAKQQDENEKTRGLEYLAKAALVYRIDGVKCGDVSAMKAVPELETKLAVGPVREKLKSGPALRKKVIETALAYEESWQKRPRPDWICAHGVKPGSYVPTDSMWQKQRQKMRAEFVDAF